jgi:NhaP-type Na+/H+ and K+/H+ antiporter
MAAEATKIQPFYEALMEQMIQKVDDDDDQETFKFSFTVSLESMICGLTVREVILPDETVISTIVRDDVSMIPKEDTQIVEDDEVIFKSQTTNPDYVEEQLSMLF